MIMFRRLFQNLDIKIVSVLIALLLWAHVVTDKEYESRVPVLLVPGGLRPGLVLVENLPKEVPVRFQSKGRDLIRMHFLRYAPTLKLNLASLPVGKNPVTLSVDEVEVPIGIIAKPLRVLHPGPLAVVLDTLWERRLRVRPVLEGDLADGYVQGDPPISTPEWVTLKGPKQLLLGFETVFTRPINLEGQDRTLEVEVPLNLSGFKLVRSEPETVTVGIPVEAMAERTLDRIQVKLVDAKRRPGTTWEPQTIRLVVQGRTQEMSKLRERAISAALDVSGLSSGTHELPARIEFPKGFVLKSASPEHFKVVLR